MHFREKHLNKVISRFIRGAMGRPVLHGAPEGSARPCDVSRSPALPLAASQRRDALNAKTAASSPRERAGEKKTHRLFLLSLTLCVCVFLRTLLTQPRHPWVSSQSESGQDKKKRKYNSPTIGFHFVVVLYSVNAPATFPFSRRLIPPLVFV